MPNLLDSQMAYDVLRLALEKLSAQPKQEVFSVEEDNLESAIRAKVEAGWQVKHIKSLDAKIGGQKKHLVIVERSAPCQW